MIKVGQYIISIHRYGLLTPAAFDLGSERSWVIGHTFIGLWRKSW